MPPSLTALILLCSAFSGSTATLGSPNNVRLSSYNMNLVLRWDRPEGEASDLLYTAEYKNQISSYKTGCLNISALECDFTPLHLSVYGRYMGRVQAVRGAESSAWVESSPLTLDRDTVIGPPSVSLVSNGATVEVSIKDPMFQISDLRNVYGEPDYNVTHWKSSRNETARKSQITQQTRLVLDDLDAWSRYCVQVQLKTGIDSRTSLPSNVTCQSTAGAGHGAPWLAAVLVLVGVSLAVALVVVVVRKRKSISRFLFPKDTLPQCLKESLPALPVSTPHPVKELHPGEELCDQVLLVTGGGGVEEEETQPDAGDASAPLRS
ncbi:interleukin-10 receptor subunit beta-like isoform X2 [Salarias fasciatus]|uniref:interleukin-10 receptor subunit beta-like isoform X2 n=1 Tax=Salarias fasciatus TaxID=181472 RepID=UPI001176F909|nr:interleukin-10 receptor subunit beta-like isoform X2 [Salarias fasciatus]